MGARSINWRSDMILNDYKGQSCVACSRIFVQEGIYDEFLKKFIAVAVSYIIFVCNLQIK